MPLTEFEIIDKYFRHLTGKNERAVVAIGDDAAVINIPYGRQLVTSMDTLVGGVHFFQDTDPFDVGYKSLAVNISDMAAMGAQPLWTTLALTVPAGDPDWMEKFAAGFATVANKYGVSLIGGDLTHGPLSITIQIMGIVERNMALTRGSAGTGDGVYVSGCLGGAGLALAGRKQENSITIQPSQTSLERFLRPEPRVRLGRGLLKLATSAIDISDGLAADLGHILEASSKGATINLESIPLCDDLGQIDDRDTRLQIGLCSGDDYELCFTVPEKDKSRLEELREELNTPLTRIGEITNDQSIKWINADGSEYELSATGYRHF